MDPGPGLLTGGNVTVTVGDDLGLPMHLYVTVSCDDCQNFTTGFAEGAPPVQVTLPPQRAEVGRGVVLAVAMDPVVPGVSGHPTANWRAEGSLEMTERVPVA